MMFPLKRRAPSVSRLPVSDIRLPSSKAAAQQRSINLAISSRGIAALRAVLGEAAAARFLATVIPMRGRMIHHADGKQESQAYDRHGQVHLLIRSIRTFEVRIANTPERPWEWAARSHRGAGPQCIFTHFPSAPRFSILLMHTPALGRISFDAHAISPSASIRSTAPY
jgi:hypothetical protein